MKIGKVGRVQLIRGEAISLALFCSQFWFHFATAKMKFSEPKRILGKIKSLCSSLPYLNPNTQAGSWRQSFQFQLITLLVSDVTFLKHLFPTHCTQRHTQIVCVSNIYIYIQTNIFIKIDIFFPWKLCMNEFSERVTELFLLLLVINKP